MRMTMIKKTHLREPGTSEKECLRLSVAAVFIDTSQFSREIPFCDSFINLEASA